MRRMGRKGKERPQKEVKVINRNIVRERDDANEYQKRELKGRAN